MADYTEEILWARDQLREDGKISTLSRATGAFTYDTATGEAAATSPKTHSVACLVMPLDYRDAKRHFSASKVITGSEERMLISALDEADAAIEVVEPGSQVDFSGIVYTVLEIVTHKPSGSAIMHDCVVRTT